MATQNRLSQTEMESQNVQSARNRLATAKMEAEQQVATARVAGQQHLAEMRNSNALQMSELNRRQLQERLLLRETTAQGIAAAKAAGLQHVKINQAKVAAFRDAQLAERDALRISLADQVRQEEIAVGQRMGLVRSGAASNVSAEREALAQTLAAEKQQAAQEEDMARAAQARHRATQDSLRATGMAAIFAGALVVAAGVGLLDLGAHFAQAAGNFESSMVLLHTHANVLPGEIGAIRQAVLDLGPAVGIGPQPLADALFRVESHMTSLPPKLQNTASAIDILTNSAKLSRIGHADLEQTTIALTNVMAAYGSQNYTAAQAAGILNRVVGEGNMRLEELVNAFSTGILPVAQQAGIRLESLGAAMATMTDMGVPASRAATYLRSALIQMTMPSGPAEQALTAIGLGAEEAGSRMAGFSELLAKAGINQSELAVKMREKGSLADTMLFLRQKLHDAGASAGETDAILNRAFGGIRSGTGVVTLYNNLDGLVRKEKDATAAGETFGGTWDYFMAHDPSQAVNRLMAAFSTLEVVLGYALIPIFIQVVGFLLPIVQGITDFAAHNQALVVAIFAVGGALMIALGLFLLLGGALAMVGAAAGAISGVALLPLLAVFAVLAVVIAAVVAAGKMLHDHWNVFAPTARALWTEMQRLWAVLGILAATALPALRKGFDDVYASLSQKGGLFDNLIKGANDFVTLLKSRDFARIAAYFIVELPFAIGVTIGWLRVVADIANMAFIQMSTTARIAYDLMKGDAGAAAKDMENGAVSMKTAADNLANDLVKTTQNLTAAQQQADRDMAITENNIFNAMNGIDLKVGDTFDHVENNVQSHLAAVQGIATKQANDLGTSIAQGIAQGLSRNSYLVQAAARAVVGDAIAAGQGAAIVASPSQLFANELGMPMGQGIAVGLQASAPQIMLIAHDIVSGTIDESGDFIIPAPYVADSTPSVDSSGGGTDFGGGYVDPTAAEQLSVLHGILDGILKLIDVEIQNGSIAKTSSLYQANEAAHFQRMRGIRGESM